MRDQVIVFGVAIIRPVFYRAGIDHQALHGVNKKRVGTKAPNLGGRHVVWK